MILFFYLRLLNIYTHKMKIKLLFVLSLSLMFSCKDENVKVIPPQKIKVYMVYYKNSAYL